MSPSTVTAARRTPSHSSAAARRRVAARRRRRSLISLAVIALLVVAVVAALPLARKAVNEFGLPLQYQGLIRQQAADKHLDPALIAAVIYAETKFEPSTSSAGAEGLMQILPQTANFLADRSGATSFTTADLGTPRVNIAYGSYYLRYLLDEYHGSRLLAIAAYNGGEANVNKWLARAHAAGTQFRVRDIPFPETRAYVAKVLQAQRDYRRTYATQLGYAP
ncbi:MAG TPA: lytic transglycosylase domain-containing protein [Solirubrobacteraceae bacterium]